MLHFLNLSVSGLQTSFLWSCLIKSFLMPALFQTNLYTPLNLISLIKKDCNVHFYTATFSSPSPNFFKLFFKFTSLFLLLCSLFFFFFELLLLFTVSLKITSLYHLSVLILESITALWAAEPFPYLSVNTAFHGLKWRTFKGIFLCEYTSINFQDYSTWSLINLPVWQSPLC